MASSEIRLCRSARAKAGQDRDAVRPAVRIPRTMVPVSSTRATTPVARMVYQTVVEVTASISCTPPGRREDVGRLPAGAGAWPAAPSSGRPAAEEHDVAVGVDQAGRHTPGGQVADGVLPPDHGGRGPGVGLHAGWCGDRHRGPDGGRGLPGPRVHDVVDGPTVAEPGPGSGARGGEPPVDDGHHLVDCGQRRGTLGGDADGPAAPGGGAGHGDVPSQVDQHADTEGLGQAGRGPIGGEGLGRSPEIDVDADRDGHGAGFGVELDPPPAGGRTGIEPTGPVSAADLVEVPVVAQLDQRRTDGRVDDARRLGSHAARHLEGFEQERADGDRTPGAVSLHLPELGVGAEPAAGIVDGTELVGQEGEGLDRPGPHR